MRIVNPIASFGEEKACKYLQSKGYKIIERNFRKGYGEIDVVAIDPSSGKAGSGQVLVFVEVKTRTSGQFGSPLESITPWKLKTLIKTAQYYKLIHPQFPDLMRIDAVSVSLLENNEVDNIELVKNISGF